MNDNIINPTPLAQTNSQGFTPEGFIDITTPPPSIIGGKNYLPEGYDPALYLDKNKASALVGKSKETINGLLKNVKLTRYYVNNMGIEEVRILRSELVSHYQLDDSGQPLVNNQATTNPPSNSQGNNNQPQNQGYDPAIYQAMIETLQGELKVKNDQIEKLMNFQESMKTVVTNSQSLLLMHQQEKQPQVMPGNKGFVINNDKVIDSEGREPVNANNEAKKKKGIFDRFFGK